MNTPQPLKDKEIDISVVIPVYNSEDNLPELSKQIKKSLDSLTYELIFITDQSLDGSWVAITQLALKDESIIGINLRKNSGQDNAIFAGIQYSKGRYVVIMDDDLQHSPADILRLYEEIKKGYDLCYANFHNKKQALWKNIGSWFNGKMAEIFIGKPKNIYLSPFKIIRRDVINEVKITNYLYPYIDGLLFSITSNITQINVKHYDRFSGVSTYTFLESVKVFIKLATGFSVLPLRVASFVGFSTSVIGLLLSLYYISEFFLFNSAPQGFTTIVVLLLILGGITLMSLGVIGEYLGRIYLSINKNKSYTIKKELNNE